MSSSWDDCLGDVVVVIETFVKFGRGDDRFMVKKTEPSPNISGSGLGSRSEGSGT